MDREEGIAAIGGVLVLVAGFLPWVTTADMGANSVVALLLGVVALGIVAVRDWERGDQFGVAAAGAVAGLWALYRLVEPQGAADTPAAGVVDIAPGIGVYVALVGGIVALVGAGIALLE